MKKAEKYIFDLDNTLIYTNILNNNAYNYTLRQLGMSQIKGYSRVTSDIVFANHLNLTTEQKKEIVRLKQAYFINNIESTEPNRSLLDVLASQKAEDCILWTSANKVRTEALLEYYKINNAFKSVLLSDKSNVKEDINIICKIWECGLEQIIVYEDNHVTIEQLRQLQVNVRIVYRKAEGSAPLPMGSYPRKL